MKIINTAFVILALSIVAITFNACQKELSFEQPATPPVVNNPVAKYTLGSSGNNCTGVELSGTYMSGVAMGSANTIKIQVTVTEKGSYKLSTAAVNGVTFEASGTFTNTGSQTISLTASGTPESSGQKAFTISDANNKCNFDITFSPAAPPAVFTLVGAPDACTSPVINGVFAVNTALSATNTVVLKVNVTTAGSYTITTNTVNGISFSGSGVFSTTGNNISVTLTGSGTPQTKTTTTLKPNISASCSFDISVADQPPVGAGIFTCKIDGVLTTFNSNASAENTLEPVTKELTLMLEGYADNNPENYFHIFISNNDKTPVKSGTYDEKHMIPTSATNLGYRIEADYSFKNPDLSTTMWNTSSSMPIINPNPPPFTITITSITATRIKGTFSGKLTNLPDNNAFKTITEGVFDLPVK